MVQGTELTREFYDSVGWTTDADGVSVDESLFRAAETDGPIRTAVYKRRWERILSFLHDLPVESSVLEVGCGGSPEINILTRFASYTGVDFSSTGLELAAARVRERGLEARFEQADAVSLPFEDARFDCVFSAHMLYHIADPEAQAASIAEMRRVLRPGGALVLHLANPRPILFPMRMGMRLVAESRRLEPLARKLRGRSPVPYNPQTIAWTRRQLEGLSEVEVVTGGIDSTAFRKTFSEDRAVGRVAWKLIDRLDKSAPGTSARLGNYVCYLCRK